MVWSEEQLTINALQANWIWVPNWIDSSPEINTAGRLVTFKRTITLNSLPSEAIIHFSADTRYKLFINGKRVSIGPSRGSTTIWYYDTLDISPYLQRGENEIKFVVLRYFASFRGAMPFGRTSFPGLTVVGDVNDMKLDSSEEGWLALVDNEITFPTGLVDDVFLHQCVRPVAHGIKTLNGDLAPWRLQPRCIPVAESSEVNVSTVHSLQSNLSDQDWTSYLSKRSSFTLSPNSTHSLDIQADVHSTAFLRWEFKAAKDKSSSINLKLTYSEGYELEPRFYPWLRTKGDRLDAINGQLIGPYDEVTLDIPAGEVVQYEPFWFRTFRLIRLEVQVGIEPVELLSFNATQVNYPMDVKASWKDASDEDSDKIWDVSIRTMRNCMFDGYSDCPFYEQLQYSGDTRSVSLFHYLLSGDDRLARQAISNFASSITSEGLTQSRYPSHVPQVIAGFSLYWILQICDHHLFFGDTTYSKSFIPRIDGVLEFFDRYIDELGLISGLPYDVWQYVDWVTDWSATDDHPDKGVPLNGRKSNRHTYFSMLYVYVLKKVATLLKRVGRKGNAEEYEDRAERVIKAVRRNCYDGQYFTDSTSDIKDDTAYSQHCQVFAVLSGTAYPQDTKRLLVESFGNEKFSKCSYVMMFYALRAYSIADDGDGDGDGGYETFWKTAWDPWRRMLKNNLTTWEEDDVRQRSDCHAWGSVPIYEYCVELAGIHPTLPGCKQILFKPRLTLSKGIEAKVALGKDNLASVSWVTQDGTVEVKLKLDKAIHVLSQMPGEEQVDQGIVDQLNLTFIQKN